MDKGLVTRTSAIFVIGILVMRILARMVAVILRTMFPGSGRHGEDHGAKARRTKCCWKCPLKGNYHYIILSLS